MSRAATASFSSSVATARGVKSRDTDLAQPGVLRRVVVDQQRLGQLQLIGCGAVGHAASRRPCDWSTTGRRRARSALMSSWRLITQ